MGGWLASFKPHIAILVDQACIAGLNIITRIALVNGMNHFVLVAYTQAVATMVIGPFAYFLERNKRPAMTCPIFCQIFVLALCGITAFQNIYCAGLIDTSAIFASAMINTIPVFVFVMATASGMEKVDMNSMYGQAKVVGTIVCVGGAMIMTFYKGPVLLATPHGLRLSTWILGALMLFVACLFRSGWVTFQAPVARKYPAPLSLTAIMLSQAAVQSILVALIFEPKASAWRVKWDIQLLNILYSGLLSSSFGVFLQMYCIRAKGPVFVAMFCPTSTILVVIFEHIILRVKLHLGSLLGAILIIAGLYTVLWGKGKDDNLERDGSEKSTACSIDIRQPLLQDDGNLQHPSRTNVEAQLN